MYFSVHYKLGSQVPVTYNQNQDLYPRKGRTEMLLVIIKMLKSEIKSFFLHGFSESWNH